jgi:hypothetical protein
VQEAFASLTPGETLVTFSPGHVLWDGTAIEVAVGSPALRLVDTLFQLGLAGLRLRIPEAAEGAVALVGHLTTLPELPNEQDRHAIASMTTDFPGIELIPLDLSGVRLLEFNADKELVGSRLVWAELARRLSRDGAFSLAGRIRSGELSPGAAAELAEQSSDPETLFDHLFVELSEILQATPESNRPFLLAQVREYLAELIGLLQEDRRKLAAAVALRHFTPTADDSSDDLLLAAGLVLDAVEYMLINALPVPVPVQRVLYRMAAPAEERPLGVDEEHATRARRLLAQLPPSESPELQLPRPPLTPLTVNWEGSPWSGELLTALDEQRLRLHTVRVLQEVSGLWPHDPIAEQAAVQLVQEFIDALDEGNFEIARTLAPTLGVSRSTQARALLYRDGTTALVAAFHTTDRLLHPDLSAMLVTIGEGAVPGILEALASEASLAVRKRLLEAVARQGLRAIPFLRPLLEDERWFLVRNVIFLLRHLGDRTSVPRLKRMLPSARPQLVTEILKTLIAVEDPQWLAHLTRVVDGDDQERAVAAVVVAARVRNPHVVRLLVDRLKRRSGATLREPLSQELIQALGQLGDPAALPVLKEILSLKQWRFTFSLAPIRRVAAEAVARLEGDEAKALAEELAADRDLEIAEAVRRAHVPTTEEETE